MGIDKLSPDIDDVAEFRFYAGRDSQRLKYEFEAFRRQVRRPANESLKSGGAHGDPQAKGRKPHVPRPQGHFKKLPERTFVAGLLVRRRHQFGPILWDSRQTEPLRQGFEEFGINGEIALLQLSQASADSSRRLKSRGSKLLQSFCDHLIFTLSSGESANRH